MRIRPFARGDTDAVVDLWTVCGLTKPWNDPHADIERKLNEQPELFVVGEIAGVVIASAMAGYDGHRGWVYYLAVHPKQRSAGHARAVMSEIERLLVERGCPKLNLQVREENTDALGFYEALGYVQEKRFSLGKGLLADD
jgi:ribosomal protein S18 acetylase RimI-like enzyme